MEQAAHRPRVSGIVSARNAALFVGEAIESALSQNFTDFELLVVDDASTDGTAEIVAGYVRRDARVRLLPLAEWKGQCVARNLAMHEARGEWIAILDADDVWLPTRLESQIAVLEEHPQACLITSDYEYLCQDGRLLKGWSCPWPEWWLRWQLLFTNALGGHSQVLFRRDVALACKGYREDRRLAEDYQLWTDLAERGRFAYAPGVQMYYRQHDHAVSQIHQESQAGQARAISFGALRALLEEEWTDERLEHVRDFWLNLFPDPKDNLWQTARDLEKLEDAFWKKHPEEKMPENRKALAGHTRWHWARIADHFWEKGLYGKAFLAWSFDFTCRLKRLRLRFVAVPKSGPHVSPAVS